MTNALKPEKNKPVWLFPIAIGKIDFDTDTDTDTDTDKIISRPAVCQTFILRAGDACLVAACPR